MDDDGNGGAVMTEGRGDADWEACRRVCASCFEHGGAQSLGVGSYVVGAEKSALLGDVALCFMSSDEAFRFVLAIQEVFASLECYVYDIVLFEGEHLGNTCRDVNASVGVKGNVGTACVRQECCHGEGELCNI